MRGPAVLGPTGTPPHRRPGITFHHPAAFWLGSAAVGTGVLMHLPMFVDSADRGYRLAGMSMSGLMLAGMILIMVGTSLAAYGLFPHASRLIHGQASAPRVRIAAMDDAPITSRHAKLLAVMVVALIVDTMKPATLGFAVPGAAEEYGISKAMVALYPFFALTGTTVGSFLWGFLADRIGRRASILLAAVIFMATGICGFMPWFPGNLAMCFLMGLAAGGLLPIAFALMSEVIPARHRGALTVLLGGVGTAGGYLAASGFASLLEPHFGWRIMWFLGLPTGATLLLLNRFIPESPRFLLSEGRTDEARNVMASFGAVIVEEQRAPAGAGDGLLHRGMGQLFRRPFLNQTAGLVLYGGAWGLVNFGFLLWLPTNLRAIGLGVGTSDRLLAKSALVALPAVALVAWVYGKWSTRRSMVLFSLLTASALAGFAVLGTGAADHELALTLLVILLLAASGGVISMLTPYASEVYPTRVRASGTGIAAGSSKAGGVIGVAMALASIAPGLVASAIVVAVPVGISALVLAATGMETGGRSLEAITAEELRKAAPVGTGRGP